MAKRRIFLACIGYRRAPFPQVSPPLGIMYIASHLRGVMDVDVVIRNQKLLNTPTDELIREIVEYAPDVVGLSALTPTAYDLAYMTEAIRAALPRTLIVLGGPHVGSFQEKALEDTAADAAVEGEGERAMEWIVNAHFDGSGLGGVPGIYRRETTGEVVRNPGGIPNIDDLDSMPFPAYDLIDLPAYWSKPSSTPLLLGQYASLFSSRGCPFKCNYCHDVFGKRFRQHSAERIVAEMELLQRQDVERFEFLDDIFNLNPKRVHRFADLVRKKGIRAGLSYPNGLRTDLLKEDVIDAMSDAGAFYSSFALETGSPRMQRIITKDLDIPRFLENVRYATRKRGIYANGFAMLGFPKETADDMQQTVDVLAESELHMASVFTVVPFPNSDLYRAAKALCPERLEGLDFGDIDYGHTVINLSEESTETMLWYQREANRRFYNDPVRLYRLLANFPNRRRLLGYLAHNIPTYLDRSTRGMFFRRGDRRVKAGYARRIGRFGKVVYTPANEESG